MYQKYIVDFDSHRLPLYNIYKGIRSAKHNHIGHENSTPGWEQNNSIVIDDNNHHA